MGAVALLLAQGAGGSAPPTAVTWNPADKDAGITLSGSNRVATKTSGDNVYSSLRATLGRSAEDEGGFYFEVVVTAATTANFVMIGVANASQVLNNYVGSGANGWAYYEADGYKYHGGSNSAYGASYTTGHVIGVLLRAGELEFFKSGVSQGVAFTGLTGLLFPAASLFRAASPAHVLTGRFKSADFTGSIPAGAAAWDS